MADAECVEDQLNDLRTRLIELNELTQSGARSWSSCSPSPVHGLRGVPGVPRQRSYDECGDSDHAVRTGLQRSGRIITSAAVLVMIASLGFALGENLGTKQMGVALAAAVLVDATLVRCLLVPATMTRQLRTSQRLPRITAP